MTLPHAASMFSAPDDLSAIIRELAPGLELMALATISENGTPWVRYVVGRMAEDGTIRFSTHLSSRKIAHIRRDPRVHVTLGGRDVKSPRWLQCESKAEISTSEEERQNFWFEGLRAFVSGVDDPDYGIVILHPTRIELGVIGTREPRVWERAKA